MWKQSLPFSEQGSQRHRHPFKAQPGCLGENLPPKTANDSDLDGDLYPSTWDTNLLAGITRNNIDCLDEVQSNVFAGDDPLPENAPTTLTIVQDLKKSAIPSGCGGSKSPQM